MLNLTSNDKELIENSYKSFLSNLKDLFENNQIKSAVDCYRILSNMLRNGQFCIDGTISFDTTFNYLDLPNMGCIGAQVMYGICCCRHVTAFINDILALIGFNASLYYIYIDDNENWHSCDPINANHTTILLIDNAEEYILDPMNNFLLKKETDNSLTSLNLDISSLDMQQFFNFSDNNVQGISKILKKYYHLQSVGINHIYD